MIFSMRRKIKNVWKRMSSKCKSLSEQIEQTNDLIKKEKLLDDVSAKFLKSLMPVKYLRELTRLPVFCRTI